MSGSHPALSRVLIVGGCGFLGHHVVRLLQQYHPASTLGVLDLHTNANRFDGVEYYDGDLTNPEDVRRVLDAFSPEAIVHTASPISALSDPKVQRELYFKVNVEGTGVLLRAAAEAHVKAFVYTSTASVVYNGYFHVSGVNEDAPVASPPLDIYTDSKDKGEKLVLAHNRQHGLLTCALRVSSMFGSGDRQLIPGQLDAIETGKTKAVLGNGKNLWDFTYVENSAYAHVLAVENLVALARDNIPKGSDTADGEAFFITNDEPIPFWDLPRRIGALLGKDIKPHVKIPYILALCMAAMAEFFAWLLGRKSKFTRTMVRMLCWDRYFDVGKAKRILNYEILVSIDEGLKRTIDTVQGERRKAIKKKDE